ncbi:MAG: GNAT family N-acetyltransferase [Oscillospiraceae bacterium]|nr:GNAT family N-acetyltransferase [Oscillospiraceae bacterium]
MDYTYRPATGNDLELIWAKNIADNPGDARWVRWRTEIITNNQSGASKTFVVLYGDAPVGEGTLVFSPACLNGRPALADGESRANISALRMDKRHEGKGHISKLVKLMERHARDAGYQVLTIGVEPKETRNLAIYLHWGYDTFVLSAMEDNELVLYYSKEL